MEKECAYSFSDLFLAAHNRPMSTEEASAFAKLSQIDRNAAVSVLAIKAGWKTRLVVGTDGQAYTTFCPTDI
jgi:hypothetical protein